MRYGSTDINLQKIPKQILVMKFNSKWKQCRTHCVKLMTIGFEHGRDKSVLLAVCSSTAEAWKLLLPVNFARRELHFCVDPKHAGPLGLDDVDYCSHVQNNYRSFSSCWSSSRTRHPWKTTQYIRLGSRPKLSSIRQWWGFALIFVFKKNRLHLRSDVLVAT